jgi:protein involved in polysaccharide export with SLBB domain
MILNSFFVKQLKKTLVTIIVLLFSLQTFSQTTGGAVGTGITAPTTITIGGLGTGGAIKTGTGNVGATQLIKDMNAIQFDGKKPTGTQTPKDFDPNNPDNDNDIQNRLNELRESGVSEEEIQRYINSQNASKQSVKDVFKIKGDLSEDEAKKQQIKALKDLPDYIGKNTNVNTEVYGGTIFGRSSLVFTPVENPVPPDDYRIGPGDNIIVTIWGEAEFQNTFIVGKDGAIFPSNIGKIFLKGVTYKNVREIIISKFKSITPSGSNIEVTIGQVRTIRVNVVGEVNQPGAYSISSLNTAFNALYLAGGPNKLGSLREIIVKRNGRNIDTLDVYKYLQHGDKQDDIYLENNDFLFVSVNHKQVDIAGEIKRPLIYQLKNKENLKDLIELAGGIKFNARLANIQVFRTENEKVSMMDLNAYEIITGAREFQLLDGDRVFIRSINDQITNKAQVIGEVSYPGIYELKRGEHIADLIAKSGGLKGEAYLQRAYVIRIAPDFQIQYIPVNLEAVVRKDSLLKSDSALQKEYEINNVEIRQFDALKIYSRTNFQDIPFFTITGLVRNSGNYILSGKRTLKDVLYICGGMKGEAEYNQVEIASIVSIEDAKRKNIPIKTIIKQYAIDPILEDDTIAEKIIISPFDQIFVRKNPDFSLQKNVSILGQVKYPGIYSKKDDKERISSLIRRSGGILQTANVKGATFKRQAVGAVILIDLGNAIKRPNSKSDIILNEGDELVIPELDEVIKITGNVQVPVNVFYDRENTDFKYYISLAGGFGDAPWKRKCTVKYANGIVKKAKNYGLFTIYPKVDYGCTLNVPLRPEKNYLRQASRLPVALLQAASYTLTTLSGSLLVYIAITNLKKN